MKKLKHLAIIVVLILSVVTMVACVNGEVLDVLQMVSSIDATYLVNTETEGEYKEKSIVYQTVKVVNDSLPMEQYQTIALQWNKLNADKYSYTMITFQLTTNIDCEFVYALVGSPVDSEDVFFTATQTCKANQETNVMVAPEGIKTEGIFEREIIIANLLEEQKGISWTIGNVQLVGMKIITEKEGI